MPKSYTLPAFAVVADSNVLYPRNPAHIVSPKFKEAWAECCAKASVKLYIPEIVRGERLYQLATVAEQSMANAVKNFSNITAVSGLSAPRIPTPEQIKDAIRDKFDQWMKEIRAVVLPLPHDKINWQQVTHDSIWRVPPFSPAGDGEDSEKGFRDCMVLETLAQLGADLKSQRQVVFLCADTLLRETATRRFDSKTLAAYEAVTSFAAYVRLARETADREYLQAVFETAPAVFYAQNSPECVYTKFSVPTRIMQQHAALLNPSAENEAKSNYSPVSEEKIFIDTTEFVKGEKDTVLWKTRLRFVRLFRRDMPSFASNSKLGDLVMGLEWMYEHVRVQTFDVYWRTRIARDVSFTELAIAEIKPEKRTVEPSFLNAAKYGLPGGVKLEPPNAN